MSVESRIAQRKGKTDTQRMLEAEKVKKGLTQVADITTDFIPGVSETKDTISLGKNIEKGDYLAAGTDAVALGLGAIPVVGDIARRGFKSLVTPKKIRKAYKLFVQREDGLYPLFVDAKNKIPEKEFIEAKFPEEAFTAPNGRMYVPSKGAKRESKIQYIDPDGKKITKAQYDELGSNAKKQTKVKNIKAEKQQATGESIIIPDEKTRKKLIEKGYITDRVKRTEEAPFGKVTAVAARPGFHASQFPVATHIGPQDIKISKKEAQKLIEAGITPEAIKKRKGQLYVKRRAEDHVYAEVDMADDIDYQSMLAKEGKTDINDKVPVGGSYKYVDGQADSDKWVVGGNMRVNRVLSKKETKKLQEELGVKDLPSKEDVENILGKKFSQGGAVEGDNMYQGVDDYVLAKTNPEQMDMNKGGTTMEKDLQAQQLEMFGDVGKMVKAPNVKDPVSGNEIPKASTAEEVRDDIPAKLSEGEFVLPADVVRYHGLEKLMKLRQQAKQGINMMDDMGQLGNSEQATMSDELPFIPNKMQEGGMVIEAPKVETPKIIPEGVRFTQPQQQLIRPSIYGQPNILPNVNAQTPQVSVPEQSQYTTQFRQLGQMPKPRTDTAATPTFQSLIGAPFGQLQKSETKKYVNSETGEELYIPFIDGKPIYPIPAGFIFEGDVKEEAKKEKPTEAIKTTRVIGQDSDDSDDVFTTGDTSVRQSISTPYQLTEEDKKGKTPAEIAQLEADFAERNRQDLAAAGMSMGVGTPPSTFSSIFGSLIDKVKGLRDIDFSKNPYAEFDLADLPIIGGIFNRQPEKGFTTDIQSQRAQRLGYNSVDEIAKNLGLTVDDRTLSLGHFPGSLHPDTSKYPSGVYNNVGILIETNPNSINYGGSIKTSLPSAPGSEMSMFNDRLNFGKNLFTMLKSNHFGGYTSNAASTTMTKNQIERENAYRDLTGMPRITSETISDGVRRIAGFNTGYDLNATRDKTKDIYVRDNGLGIIRGGTWRNVEGMGLQYDRGPGRGTVLGQRNPRTGKIEIGYFNTKELGRSSITKDPKVKVDLSGIDIKPDPTFKFTPDTQEPSKVRTDSAFPTDKSVKEATDRGATQIPTLPTAGPTQTGSYTYDYYQSDDSDSGADPTSPDSTDMGFSTAVGGFIKKRNLSKAKKKMKRGGLASRK